MKIYHTTAGIVIADNGHCFLSLEKDWDVFINRDHLYRQLIEEVATLTSAGGPEWLEQQQILAPVGTQEIWAAGVTYLRSKTARMEESRDSGGATFYDKVYEAARPELFFKSVGSKVMGHRQPVRIRKDSTWNVPEPELTLVINSSGTIAGYTIGNDMSSRSIEGENPLYLPQAKVYDGSAAIGPCVLVSDKPLSPDTVISMFISRQNKIVFEGSVAISQMKRSHQELVDYLYRESSFAGGACLMTGTCVVPDNDFTLAAGDVITIHIEGIGTLVNTVAT